MRQRYFEFHDEPANSHKFYRVTFQDDGMALIEWGRIGSSPQSQLKSHGEAEGKIDEKISKGYAEKRASKMGQEVFPVKKGTPRPKPAPATTPFLDGITEISRRTK